MLRTALEKMHEKLENLYDTVWHFRNSVSFSKIFLSPYLVQSVAITYFG